MKQPLLSVLADGLPHTDRELMQKAELTYAHFCEAMRDANRIHLILMWCEDDHTMLYQLAGGFPGPGERVTQKVTAPDFLEPDPYVRV